MTTTLLSLDKSKIRFLLLEGIHQSAVDTLKAHGYTNIDYLSTSLPDDELKVRISDAHFVGIRSQTQLTEEIFVHAEKLIVVGCFCIDTNQTGMKAATRHGIAVFNAPYSNTRSVAELVLAEAILLLRNVPEKNAQVHRGKWRKTAKNAYEIRGKKLGIIGYGNIGSQLSVLAESLGMEVYFYDVVTRLPLGNASQIFDLNELLSLADIITLHVPEAPSTNEMIGEAELATMKNNAILINASRGTVVAIDALASALQSKKLLGAAIDVFPVEPQSNNETFFSPLREFDNVILTPHIGGSTLEAQEKIGKEVVSKLVTYSDNGTSLSSVNFPEVVLPPHPDKHRILHIHDNVPSVLSAVNHIFPANNINISSQYLQTCEEIGYVVLDVKADQSRLAQERLQEVHGTICFVA